MCSPFKMRMSLRTVRSDSASKVDLVRGMWAKENMGQWLDGDEILSFHYCDSLGCWLQLIAHRNSAIFQNGIQENVQ